MSILNTAVAAYNHQSANTYHLRSPQEIASYFDGLDLVEPGVVATASWRPDPDAPETDAPDVSVAGLQRPADREIVEIAIKEGSLAPQFGRRVRVGVGHQAVAVERRQPPIHRRVGGEAGLDGKDVVREIAVALADGVEARL